MTKIRVLSLDYDGCLAQKNSNTVADNFNEALAKKFLETANNYSETIVFVGSNRQSKRDDDRNTTNNNNGSCYQYIPLFCKSISAQFNPFLLADLYNDMPHGTALNEALIDNNNTLIHKGWLHDPSKVSVLYAQIQKIASEHPDEEIDFEFYDDKQGILNDLYQFFSINNTLIPKKINLKLCHYDGSMETLSKSTVLSIQGQGDHVNSDYAQTIKSLGNRVLVHVASTGNLFNVDGNNASVENIQQNYYNSGCAYSIIEKSSLIPDFSSVLAEKHLMSEPNLLKLKSDIAAVIKTYKTYTRENCKFSIFHRHGETGRIRADNFLIKIDKINDFDNLKKELSNFINDDKNGNTNPHSLRTMLFYKYFQDDKEIPTLKDAAKRLISVLGAKHLIEPS